MSVKIENTIDESEISEAHRTDKTIAGVSSDLIEERIRANLDNLNAQILTLTQVLNQLTKDSSAKTVLTATPRTHRLQT